MNERTGHPVDKKDWRDVVVYGWLLAVTVGVAVAIGLLYNYIHVHHHDQFQTNIAFCRDENYVINYLVKYNGAATPAQLHGEERTIDGSFPAGNEVRIVLDTIIAAELATPSLSDLHPFELKPLKGC